MVKQDLWRYKNQRWSEALNRKKINKNGKVGFEVVVGDYDFDHLKKRKFKTTNYG